MSRERWLVHPPAPVLGNEHPETRVDRGTVISFLMLVCPVGYGLILRRLPDEGDVIAFALFGSPWPGEEVPSLELRLLPEQEAVWVDLVLDHDPQGAAAFRSVMTTHFQAEPVEIPT